jgi:amino acid transporter
MFKSIVFSQFYEIKKQGKDPLRARPLAILMVFILLALLMLFIFLLVKDVSALSDFGMQGGKTRSKAVGRVVGLIILVVVYALTYLGLGENLIKRYLIDFEKLDAATQSSESKKGLRNFAISLFTLLALIIGLAIYRS